MISRTVFLAVLLVATFQGYGQTVSNVVAKLEGEQIQISYDLGGSAGESYEIKLTYSRDGGKTFSSVPASVSGAVNRWEAPGSGKQINWEAKKDLGDFEGNLSFKVTANGKSSGTVTTTASAVTPAPVSNGGETTSSGSLSAENELINFTITSVYNVPDGFKIFFKIRAKREQEVSIGTGTTVQDQLGNTYSIFSSDIEGQNVLKGKPRKFMAASRKDGEMILKVVQAASASLNGRMIKSLNLQTSAGNFIMNDIPRN